MGAPPEGPRPEDNATNSSARHMYNAGVGDKVSAITGNRGLMRVPIVHMNLTYPNGMVRFGTAAAASKEQVV